MLDRWPHVLYHLDQPHGDASFMPTLRVSELAARHVKVVLTGDGGDELFAGYDKYSDFFGRADTQELAGGDFQRSYFDSISLFSPQAKRGLYQPALAAQLEGVDSFEVAARPWFDEAAHFDRINQALYLDMQLLLSGNNLVKPDRMGMAVSIEARTPFLDWRMMEFAFRSRGSTKLHGQDKKHWYKQAAAPLIGGNLAYRKKQMFTVPVGEWFRGESYPWLAGLLQDSALLARLFRPEAVQVLLQRHRDGSANNTRELRALAALALWAQQAGA
jgi:asparagine synthase (glutamine-hydrolysing)